MNKLDNIEQQYMKENITDFNPGDTIKVHYRITEGEKTRIQVFQGVVIRRNTGGSRESFTVRKISYGVGVERIFPLHSPNIEKIEVTREGKVRRARLYYLRALKGKKAQVKAKNIYGNK